MEDMIWVCFRGSAIAVAMQLAFADCQGGGKTDDYFTAYGKLQTTSLCTARKLRLARARALPDAEAAKLRGADRITQMMRKRKQKKEKKPTEKALGHFAWSCSSLPTIFAIGEWRPLSHK